MKRDGSTMKSRGSYRNRSIGSENVQSESSVPRPEQPNLRKAEEAKIPEFDIEIVQMINLKTSQLFKVTSGG